MRAKQPSTVGDWLKLDKELMLKKWYLEYYSRTTYNKNMDFFQRLSHWTLEKNNSSSDDHALILEIGANSAEHLKYINHNYNIAILGDLNPTNVTFTGDKVIPLVFNGEHLPFKDNTFDRIYITCLLHHVQDPEKVLVEMRRVSKSGGILDIFLSGDPSLLFRLARFLGPGRNARKLGLGQVKKLVDARDHINHVGRLRVLISHSFRSDSVKKIGYPINGFPQDLTIWYTYHVRVNK